MRVEIEHILDDEGHPLVKTSEKAKASTKARRWVFRIGDGIGVHGHRIVRLVEYAELERASHRHKWRVAQDGRRKWDANDERSYYSGIARKDVPVPLSVQKQAVAAVRFVFKAEGFDAAEVGPLGGEIPR
jgi:hypothetical protein